MQLVVLREQLRNSITWTSSQVSSHRYAWSFIHIL